jgi:hypothetical protein
MDECVTDEEAAAYRMLHQVLQNHVTLQEMSILAASMACTGLLGDHCLECCTAGTTPLEVVADMLVWLKRGVRKRQSLPALLPFGQASAHAPEVHLGEHSRHLYDALRRLLNDVREAQRIDSLGSRQIGLRLLADVLSMFLHQFALPLEAVDKIIDEVVGPSLDSYLKTNILQTQHHAVDTPRGEV